MAKETEKIIERMDKLEEQLFNASRVDAMFLSEHMSVYGEISYKRFEYLVDQLDQIEKKVGYIRISLTTVLVALGFIAFEVIRHWVL